MREKKHAPTRFLALVDFSDPEGCHTWTGKKNSDGYGLFWLDGRWVGAHRYMAGWFGLPPASLKACHHCDNPPCVNRDHLFLSTHAGNMLDMALKGKRRGVGGRKGSAHHMSRLTDIQVEQIRNGYGRRGVGGKTIYQLAEEFGVRPQQISRIVRGERWAA